MPVPLIVPLAAMGIQAAQGIAAGVRGHKAKKELAEIEKNKKNITTPSIIEEYVKNPITAENRQFIADQAAQRVGTSVGAMSKGGLATMGGLSTMMANEARNDSKLQSDFSQLEREAALVGGQYASRTQDAARRDWEQQMQGAQLNIADNRKIATQAFTNLGSTAISAGYAGMFNGGNGLFGNGGNGGGAEASIPQPQVADPNNPLFNGVNATQGFQMPSMNIQNPNMAQGGMGQIYNPFNLGGYRTIFDK